MQDLAVRYSHSHLYTYTRAHTHAYPRTRSRSYTHTHTRTYTCMLSLTNTQLRSLAFASPSHDLRMLKCILCFFFYSGEQACGQLAFSATRRALHHPYMDAAKRSDDETSEADTIAWQKLFKRPTTMQQM